MLKVGELATRTGLTVRTLHFYDEIGLLAPAARTRAGHRLYSVREVERLQQIGSLRGLGLSLEEIRACLERPDVSLERVLEMHLERLDEELDLRRRLRGRLETLLERVRSEDEASLEELLVTIEVTTMFEKYYTPEQLEQLRAREETIGQERIEEAQDEWAAVFAGFQEASARGAEPSDPEVLALARKARSLIEEFTGGDPGIARSLANMYRSEGPERVLGPHGYEVAGGAWELMQKASAALGGGDET